jgi:hypothetical protein
MRKRKKPAATPARDRGRDDVRASALHGPHGTVLDVAIGARAQGIRPQRLENGRLQTTEDLCGKRN